MSKPLILLTGCFGQLGTAIHRCWDAASLSAAYELLSVDASQLDLTDEPDVRAYLDQLKPRYIINTAAYTQVDNAESDAEAAFALNGDAVSVLAQWCSKNNSNLIQISTDFVFDGQVDSPYLPESATGPLSVYGASKLAGEHHVRDRLPHGGIIVRTAWLYSEFGNNFVKTMLRLMGEMPQLKVVNDQIGSPTSARTRRRPIGPCARSSGWGGCWWSAACRPRPWCRRSRIRATSARAPSGRPRLQSSFRIALTGTPETPPPARRRGCASACARAAVGWTRASPRASCSRSHSPPT